MRRWRGRTSRERKGSGSVVSRGIWTALVILGKVNKNKEKIIIKKTKEDKGRGGDIVITPKVVVFDPWIVILEQRLQ